MMLMMITICYNILFSQQYCSNYRYVFSPILVTNPLRKTSAKNILLKSNSIHERAPTCNDNELWCKSEHLSPRAGNGIETVKY